MISSNVEGIPLFIKAASGNKTDKTEFPEVLEAYMEQMSASEEPYEGYTVADSALYSAENLNRIKAIQWISRVPETLQQAREELSQYKQRQWQDSEQAECYKYVEVASNYGSVAQRWLIVWSCQAQKRSKKTVLKQVKQEKAFLTKGVKGLKKQRYETQEAA